MQRERSGRERQQRRVTISRADERITLIQSPSQPDRKAGRCPVRPRVPPPRPRTVSSTPLQPFSKVKMQRHGNQRRERGSCFARRCVGSVSPLQTQTACNTTAFEVRGTVKMGQQQAKFDLFLSFFLQKKGKTARGPRPTHCLQGGMK